QLNARVAGDLRSGGLRADVIWACDPLTMHGYDSQGLLADWTPAGAAGIPAAYRNPRFTGVDVLYMVAVVHNGTAPPTAWLDLTKPAYRGAVALPDPSFAASALGTLGYLAAAPGYGLDFYEQLKSNGAKQVNSPDDVLTGVEQGRYRAGITLANTAYVGQKKGSPIQVVWPQPGGIAIYAPIGVTTRKHRSPSAGEFASFVASPGGQKIMAGAGTHAPGPGTGRQRRRTGLAEAVRHVQVGAGRLRRRVRQLTWPDRAAGSSSARRCSRSSGSSACPCTGSRRPCSTAAPNRSGGSCTLRDSAP